MMTKNRIEETAAAEIVSVVTQCSVRVTDTGTVQSAVDCSLSSTDGDEIGVMEVTTATYDKFTSFYGEDNRRHRAFAEPQLGHSWTVSVNGPIKLKRLRQKLVEKLRALENQDIHSVSAAAGFVGEESEPLPDALVRLGVIRAETLATSPTGDGWVFIGVAPQTGWGPSVGVVTTTAETLINESGNLDKVRSGPGPRAELFIWANPPTAAASALAIHSMPPFSESVSGAQGPSLPSGVTGIWIATWNNNSTSRAGTLWRSNGGSWSVLQPPEHGPIVESPS